MNGTIRSDSSRSSCRTLVSGKTISSTTWRPPASVIGMYASTRCGEGSCSARCWVLVSEETYA